MDTLLGNGEKSPFLVHQKSPIIIKDHYQFSITVLH